MKTALNHDGIGFVNNRGKSKYWGVVKHTGGKFIVCVAPHNMFGDIKAKGVNLFPSWDMTEEEAAFIAAAIYSRELRNKGINRIKIKSRAGDAWYMVDFKARSITKSGSVVDNEKGLIVDFTSDVSKIVDKDSNNLLNYVDQSDDKGFKLQPSSEVSSFSNIENELIRGFVNDLLEHNRSEKFYHIIIKLAEIGLDHSTKN